MQKTILYAVAALAALTKATLVEQRPMMTELSQVGVE